MFSLLIHLIQLQIMPKIEVPEIVKEIKKDWDKNDKKQNEQWDRIFDKVRNMSAEEFPDSVSSKNE